MKRLKDTIRDLARKGMCHVIDNYKGPDELGDILLEDLKRAIIVDFPFDQEGYPIYLFFYIQSNTLTI